MYFTIRNYPRITFIVSSTTTFGLSSSGSVASYLSHPLAYSNGIGVTRCLAKTLLPFTNSHMQKFRCAKTPLCKNSVFARQRVTPTKLGYDGIFSSKDLLIRQFSEKKKQLRFTKNVVTINHKQRNRGLNTSWQFNRMPGLAVMRYNQNLYLYPLRCRCVPKRSFGKAKLCINEVLATAVHQLRFGKATGVQRVTQATNITPFLRDVVYDNVHQLVSAGRNSYRLNPNQKLGCLYPTNLDKMSFLSSDLANLGLSLKSYTYLKQKGIHKIGNIVEYSPKSLLKLLNRNKEMFAELKRCFLLLAVYGDVPVRELT